MKALVMLATSALLALLLCASAYPSVPSGQDRLDAKRFAREWWAARGEVPNCSGVGLRWRDWRYDPVFRDYDALAYVPFKHRCTIVFNRNVNWKQVPERAPGEITNLGEKWWRFCATAIHEWGHLRGMPFSLASPPIHSRSRNHIMADSEGLNTRAWWWPFFPGCSYKGDGVYDETEE